MNAVVILWPKVNMPAIMGGGSFHSNAGAEGNFLVQAVAPGTYYLAAIEEIESNLSVVRELLDQFEDQAATVIVKSGEPPIFQAPLIPKAKVQDAISKLP